MNFPLRLRSLTAMALAVTTLGIQAPVAHASSHFSPPGIKPCFNLGNVPCSPPNPGGLVNPPAPPGPQGGGFGSGLGAGIGLGVGLGLVQGLTRPAQPQVIYQQQQPVYVQPAPVQVAPQPVSGGLSPHDQFCLNKYKSYNIQSKQYLSFSGGYKFCKSPYM